MNGVNVGFNLPLFFSNTLNDGDIVSVSSPANNACQTTNIATGSVTMVVFDTPVTPSVTIDFSPAVICSGSAVTFSALPVNGGPSPSYQWTINGVNVPGETNDTFVTSTLSNFDVVNVIMTANNACQTTNTDLADAITAIVNPTVSPTATIASDDADNTYCEGTQVIFTATVQNGGASPTYQWQLNGIDISGENGLTLTLTTLQNGDQVSFVLTGDNVCQTVNTVNTPAISQIVNPVIDPVVSILIERSGQSDLFRNQCFFRAHFGQYFRYYHFSVAIKWSRYSRRYQSDLYNLCIAKQ